jgi:hypothetical protein
MLGTSQNSAQKYPKLSIMLGTSQNSAHRTTQRFLSYWALHKILITGNQRQETLIARAMGIIRAEQEKCSGQEGRRMLLQKGIDRFFQGSKNSENHKVMWMCVALICVSLLL